MSARPVPRAAGLALAALLVALAAGPAHAQTARFAPRQPPAAGARFVETSTWRTTGHNRISVGALDVRDKEVDALSAQTLELTVDEVTGGEVTTLRVVVRDQVERDGDEAEALGLDGVEILVRGKPGARAIGRSDGGRLKRAQRKWLEAQFAGDPDAVDPLALLLPDGEVAVGASWDLRLDRVHEFLGGEERFSLDRASSHARVTLAALVDEGGVPCGRFAFDVLVVPSALKDATPKEARMTIVGTALLPLSGAVGAYAYDVVSTVRFLGTGKRSGITADVDLDLRFEGKVARRAR